MTRVGCGTVNRGGLLAGSPNLESARGMNRKMAWQVVAVVALMGWATWNVLRMSAGRALDLQPYEALGVVAGEEASRLVGGTGEVGLVLPDEAGEANPVMDAQVEAFRKGLASAGRARVGRVSRVLIDGFTAMRTGGAVPLERVASLLEEHRRARAVVFFMGLPLADESVLGREVVGDRKVVVISASFPWYPSMVQQGLVHLAIVPLASPGTSGPGLGTGGALRAAFDREYQVLRPGSPLP